jgi:HD-like signal output (HDOD) protein
MNKADVDALAAELSGLELPVLRSTRDDIVAIANNAKLSMSQFGRALFKDMGLALKVLRVANSIEPRRFGTELESLEKAAMMVGVDRIARLASDSATIEQAVDESVQVRLKRLYARSYLTALMAESWAEARHDISPGEVGLAGLFYNLGGVLLWLKSPRAMQELAELKLTPGVYPHEAEHVGLGFNLEPVGYRVAESMRLPRLAIEAMKAQYAQELRSLGVMLAAQMAYTATRDWDAPDLRARCKFVADYVGIKLEQLPELIERVITRFNAERDIYGVEPLSSLDEERMDAIAAARVSAPTRFCLAPRRDILKANMQALAKGGLNEESIVNLTVETMRTGLALNRALFARLMPDGDVLHAISFTGTDYEPAFNHFRLSLEGEHLLSLVMKKPTGFWMNEASRPKAWQHMPVEMAQLIGVDSFFVLSVFVDGAPYGLFYADRREPACALDARSFEDFKRLGALTASALGKARAARTEPA